MKLAVLSQNTLSPSYSEISNLQEEYCLSLFRNNNIPAFRYKGSRAYTAPSSLDVPIDFNGNFFYLNKTSNELYLNCPDIVDHSTGLDPRGYKTYYAFKFLLENIDFDILLTTTCTSYLDVNNIIREVQSFPKERLYVGAVSSLRGTWFVISAFAFISKDLVKKVVENKEKYLEYTTKSFIGQPYGEVFEDVAIGRLFEYLDLKLKINTEIVLPHPIYYKLSNVTQDNIVIDKKRYSYRFGTDQINYYKHLHKLFLNS